MSNCIHNKVYESAANLVANQKSSWICSTCGQQGSEGGKVNSDLYHALIEKYTKPKEEESEDEESAGDELKDDGQDSG